VDRPPVLVVGIGNEFRGDDGAGIAVVRRLGDDAGRAGVELREHQTEPSALLDVWAGRPAVVIVDCMRSGAPAGTIRCFDVTSEPLPAQLAGTSSTHAVALDQAIELARALGRLPRRLILFTVEGATFAAGTELSADLANALPAVAAAVLHKTAELRAQVS
jgi:hydrogenase maturation protease